MTSKTLQKFQGFLDTNRIHKDKNGRALCKIYTLPEKITRYPCKVMPKIREKARNLKKLHK